MVTPLNTVVRLSAKYDSEWRGFIELTALNSVNPSNSMSYFGTVKSTTLKMETTRVWDLTKLDGGREPLRHPCDKPMPSINHGSHSSHSTALPRIAQVDVLCSRLRVFLLSWFPCRLCRQS